MVIILLLLSCLIPSTAMGVSAITFPIQKGDSGPNVVAIQQRLFDLGYVHFRPTGKFGDMTSRGVNQFQLQSGIQNDGIVGETTFTALFLPDAKRAPINAAIPRTVGPGLMATPTVYGARGDWRVISENFPIGSSVTVTDFNTMKSFQIMRTGGNNHADVQPTDSSSRQAMLKAFGGGSSWEKRPVLVQVGDVLYAASLFGMPNGDGKKGPDDLSGSYCLYFEGSTSDFTKAADPEHKANILKAAGES